MLFAAARLPSMPNVLISISPICTAVRWLTYTWHSTNFAPNLFLHQKRCNFCAGKSTAGNRIIFIQANRSLICQHILPSRRFGSVCGFIEMPLNRLRQVGNRTLRTFRCMSFKTNQIIQLFIKFAHIHCSRLIIRFIVYSK